MPEILCDSSSLISITRSCFDSVLLFMHNSFNIQFFIPPSVEKEVITLPLNSHEKQYALSAMRLKNAMRNKIILRIDANIMEEANELSNIANNIFFANDKAIRIVHLGEMELIALAQHLKIDNLLIDERTVRMVIESPFYYKKHLEKEFTVNVMINKQNFSRFQDITKNMKIIRSSELLIVAYENGFMDGLKELKAETLNAGLYNLKYSGCAIRYDEIKRIMEKVE